MRTTIRRFGLWLAARGGWTPCTHAGYVPQDEVSRLVVEIASLEDSLRASAQSNALLSAASRESELAADRAKAVADSFESRYLDLLRAHERLTGQVVEIVAERDRAREDFQLYVKHHLDIRPDLRVRAEYLVGLLAKKGAHLSGEFKRHQVYADLIKEFPQIPHRDISLAIEMAVRTRP